MSEGPLQTLLQQRDARPVPGEHLEVLGKKAASDWMLGKFASLHEAVVDAVRHEQLAPEQVRRVVEFCNQDAYLQEFRKEGGHRVVHFDCGPADPAQVLQDLNDGGGGSLTDRGTLDYKMPPSLALKEASSRAASLEKTASVGSPSSGGSLDHYTNQLWALLGGGKEQPLVYADPFRELKDTHDKLASARDQLSSELDRLEIDYADACNHLYFHVKQAALEGMPLGDVVTAWASVETNPAFVKAAFQVFAPKLRQEGVFPSLDALGDSLMKTAAAQRQVNQDHPLVQSYREFCDALNKLAQLRALHGDFEDGASQSEELLKRAAGGLVGGVMRGARAVGNVIDDVSPTVATALVGKKGAKDLAPALAKGLKVTGLVGAGLAGNAALQSVTDRPLVRNTLGAAKSIVPGTAEYEMRRYRTMTGQ